MTREENKPHTILMMHAHELARLGLRQLVEGCMPGLTLLEAADRPALERMLAGAPNVAMAILQAEGPHRSVVNLFQWMARHHPHTRVIALGTPDRRLDRRLVDVGARALLGPGVDQTTIHLALDNVRHGLWHTDHRMREALTGARRAEAAAAAEMPFTDRQLEVLRYAAHPDEPSYNRIGQWLHISRRTVEAHIRELMRRYGVGKRADLVRKARRKGQV